MTVLATLPLDVLDRIMTSVADFTTLRASALTCKNLYGTFNAHPTSIIKAVAHNLVPATALALVPAVALLPFAFG